MVCDTLKKGKSLKGNAQQKRHIIEPKRRENMIAFFSLMSYTVTIIMLSDSRMNM